MTKANAVRPVSYVAFGDHECLSEAGWRLCSARGKTFLIDWAESDGETGPLQRSSDYERIVIFPYAGGLLHHDQVTYEVPPRTIVVVPAGVLSLSSRSAAIAILLSPIADEEVAPSAINGNFYGDRDAGIRLLGHASAAQGSSGVQVIPIDGILPPPDKPRLRMVRSGAMSISWIEYDGERDRSGLSPHSHDDFEQGSLAVEGSFVHHLRVPWGANANEWRDDIHLEAAPRSLCVIPPKMIHTTEGSGGGKHILIDIFAPPREDFISKGWVSNGLRYGPGA